MSSNTNINIRLDLNLKNQAKAMLKSMGMTMSQLLTMCLIQMLEERRLPFTVKEPTSYNYGYPNLTPNAETKASFNND